jgi:hypothetical protein
MASEQMLEGMNGWKLNKGMVVTILMMHHYYDD